MRSVEPLRPVLALLLVGLTAGCGMVENDPHRFERMAERVAAIPLEGSSGARRAEAPRSATEAGLRPAHAAPLRVEVMTPHALWDAREAGLRGAVTQAAAEAASAAAPALIQAATHAVVEAAPPLRPAHAPSVSHPPQVRARAADRASTLMQLGAFGSESAARAAWSRLKQGPAAAHLDGATPVFERVDVNGRTLVRLKAPAPAQGAAVVCAAAGIDDPWCRRTG